jgi:hypothetical protein
MLPAPAIVRRALLPAAGLALLVLAATGALPGLIAALAYLLPLLLLLLAMKARGYPGERALLARMGGRSGDRARPSTGSSVPISLPRATVPRGGCLIAFSLAVRPPPATRAVTS